MTKRARSTMTHEYTGPHIQRTFHTDCTAALEQGCQVIVHIPGGGRYLGTIVNPKPERASRVTVEIDGTTQRFSRKAVARVVRVTEESVMIGRRVEQTP